MDKFMNSSWFTKIVALALTVLLFTSVNFTPGTGKKSLGFNTPGEIGTETIKNVPVEVYYDRDNLVVTGAPKSVDVTLKGVKSLLISAKNQREFKVYIDLSDPEIAMGEKKVPLKIRDINEKLTASVNPEYTTVKIQEKVTKEFSVDPEYNRSLIEDGYTADKPAVSPQTVKITGAKDIIDQIAYVKATMALSGRVNETVHRQATVRALDRDLNKLNVSIEPSVVDVSLNVNIPSKTVKLVPVQTGTPKDTVSIKSMTVFPKNVTLYGKQSVLDSIHGVSVPVDVSNIDNSKEVELPITVPDGVKKMSLGTATVKIQTEKVVPADKNTADTEKKPPEKQDEQTKSPDTSTQTKVIKNLDIVSSGLADDQDLTFISPKGGKIDLTLSGTADDLQKVKPDDIQITVDATGLEEGEHDAAIQVKVPANIKWELPVKTAKVSITKKDKET
ncbi:CdaR family protein [Bacillus sp. MUM 13]|uniref:CdaR family protein n=1 Tax=Bacillus sp. MUM 13 TaxID=1678001 RepID=UPI0008F59D4B|nr:CdaR family protein [Bacillus sp. MUM 13]OIK10212.1 hypothetical protein BIV59_14785 [Bacillus sp. MUM 13]